MTAFFSALSHSLRRLTCFSLAWLLGLFLLAQSPILPTPLNDTTALSVLNARFGSRFTFTASNSERGIRTGALGFDADEIAPFYLGLESGGSTHYLRSMHLPAGHRYLEEQQLDFGLTFCRWQGQTAQDLKLTFRVVLPFTPSESLADSSAIATQIAPLFYLLVEVNNEGTEAQEGRLRLGFQRTPIRSGNAMGDRYYRRGPSHMYFRDNAAFRCWQRLSGREDYHRFYNQRGLSGLERAFALAAGETLTDTLIFATYYDGEVVHDRRSEEALRFYYTQLWPDVEAVTDYGWQKAEANLGLSARFERLLQAAEASQEEKWVAALSFHNDLANALLLVDEAGAPRFYHEEGRFQHLSTIDVAHETEVNALFAPWRLRLQLAQWSRYLAVREVEVPPNPVLGKNAYREGMTAAEFGPFLYHDVGDFPFVDATSNYDYGPTMAVEENTDYVLLLYWYWRITGDDAFVQSLLGLSQVLMQSVQNRDLDGNGLVDTGYGWTTYDVNEVLKMAPENVYLGVKQYCAYLLLAEMQEALARREDEVPLYHELQKKRIEDGEGAAFSTSLNLNNAALRDRQAAGWRAAAEQIYATLAQARQQHGYLPLSLDQDWPGWDQRSVVLGEGLFLPGLAGAELPALEKMADLLAKDYAAAYDASEASYGIRLASGEPATWFSKVMVSDLVARRWYGQQPSTAGYAYRWNRNNPFAYNDGATSPTRNWTGYWYPRGVASLGYLLGERTVTAASLKRELGQP